MNIQARLLDLNYDPDPCILKDYLCTILIPFPIAAKNSI